jgi:hypothetical protein
MSREMPCPTSPASTHGDDVVSNRDAQQQPRNCGKQQPRKPIAHSFTSAQSRPVVPQSECMHRAYFRFGIQVSKGPEDLRRAEFEERQSYSAPAVRGNADRFRRESVRAFLGLETLTRVRGYRWVISQANVPATTTPSTGIPSRKAMSSRHAGSRTCRNFGRRRLTMTALSAPSSSSFTKPLTSLTSRRPRETPRG